MNKYLKYTFSVPSISSSESVKEKEKNYKKQAKTNRNSKVYNWFWIAAI